MREPRNNLVVIAGGIGDALLWVPALKRMTEKPDVLYVYGAPKINLLRENELVKNSFVAEDKFSLLRFALRNLKRYDKVYMNHLCGGEILFRSASFIASQVVSNSFHYQEKKCLNIKPQNNLHDAMQNMRLCGYSDLYLNESDFRIERRTTVSNVQFTNYICVHLSAGSDQTPYKNWPLRNWKNFLQQLSVTLPQYKLILMGGKEEAALGRELESAGSTVINKVGSTTLDAAFDLLSSAQSFIGPDGGLMHLAVCAGTPTFTLWGGSSLIHYAYDHLIPGRHAVISRNLSCSPCDQWLQPNTSRVQDPLKCPDFACIRELSSEKVVEAFLSFTRNIKKKNG